MVGGRYDRRHVVETLGGCGVLETPEHPGFTTKWTTFAARQARPSTRVECDPPIAFWTAGHGVNADNVRGWFGHLGVTAPKTSATRAAAADETVARASAAKSRSDARAARSTELETGDALALAVSGGWVGAVVVGHHVDRGGRTATIVFVDWRGAEPPTIESLRARRALGFAMGSGARHAPAMFARAWKRRDPRDRWRWLGTGLPIPDHTHLIVERGTGIVRPGEVDRYVDRAQFSRGRGAD